MSVRFWGYAAMLLTLALVGDRLVQWTERCPCHEDIIQSMLDPNDKYNWYKINKIWNTFLTEPTMFHHCPCNGLRAPDMVEMKMLKIIDEEATLFESYLLEKLEALGCSVDSEDQDAILFDWRLGQI